MMQLDKIKRTFRSSMKHIYPDGDIGSKQLRDLCRVFIMGWVGAVLDPKDNEEGGGMITGVWPTDDPEFKRVTDENWWPDDSWKWWN